MKITFMLYRPPLNVEWVMAQGNYYCLFMHRYTHRFIYAN